jgi:hypothetical protein
VGHVTLLEVWLSLGDKVMLFNGTSGLNVPVVMELRGRNTVLAITDAGCANPVLAIVRESRQAAALRLRLQESQGSGGLAAELSLLLSWPMRKPLARCGPLDGI